MSKITIHLFCPEIPSVFLGRGLQARKAWPTDAKESPNARVTLSIIPKTGGVQQAENPEDSFLKATTVVFSRSFEECVVDFSRRHKRDAQFQLVVLGQCGSPIVCSKLLHVARSVNEVALDLIFRQEPLALDWELRPVATTSSRYGAIDEGEASRLLEPPVRSSSTKCTLL